MESKVDYLEKTAAAIVRAEMNELKKHEEKYMKKSLTMAAACEVAETSERRYGNLRRCYNQVKNTDRKLEDLSWKVEKWERAVSQVSLFEEASLHLESEQEDCVLNLLQDVTQVREDYEQLRSDIIEIQQLQRELSECLRTQLNHMHAKYGFLRSKLGPALPSCLMMSTNSYRSSPTKHINNGNDTNSQ